MAFLSHSKKEIKAKIVYYGPGMSGKTSNIEYIHKKMRSDHRGDLVNLSTNDRTLFFDFLPVELGNIKGYRTRFHTFTVPGQVFYNETRKAVLKDVDGIVFVADSQKKMRDENTRSLKNLEENLAYYGLKLSDIPHVFQYNKRDMPDILTLEELHRELNKTKAPFFEAVAIQGVGVLNTLKLISKMVLKKLATSPAGAIKESDEAFEEQNYGLSNDYVVVKPGDEGKAPDSEAVVTAIEIDVPSGEEIMEAAEVVEEGGAAPEPVEVERHEETEIEIDDVEPAAETAESDEPYEAQIENEQVDESEIPAPPSYSTAPVEEELKVEPAPAPAAQPPAPNAANTPVAAAESAPAQNPVQPLKAAPDVKELNLYQWGFPERIGNNSIKVPLYFRDNDSGQEYWSYLTVSLDNILKR